MTHQLTIEELASHKHKMNPDSMYVTEDYPDNSPITRLMGQSCVDR